MIISRICLLLVSALIGAGTSAKSPNPENPICIEDHILLSVDNGHPATLVWQDSDGDGEGVRRVSVMFDGAGNYLQYSEVVTSVPWVEFDRQGTYRMVFLNFETDFGVVELQNSEDGRSQEQRDIDEVLASPDLGNPLEAIRQVKMRCTAFQGGTGLVGVRGP